MDSPARIVWFSSDAEDAEEELAFEYILREMLEWIQHTRFSYRESISSIHLYQTERGVQGMLVDRVYDVSILILPEGRM